MVYFYQFCSLFKFSGSDDKLVLITKRYEVGKLKDEDPVYRIEKIAIVPLSSDECPDIDFDVSLML